jgi:hypothetical protein
MALSSPLQARPIMQHTFEMTRWARSTRARVCILLGLGLLSGVGAFAAKEVQDKEPVESLPQRELLIDVREVEDGGEGYSAGTDPQEALMPAQRVRVQNGKTAQIRMTQNIPVQWLKSAQRYATPPAPTATAGTTTPSAASGANGVGGGVKYGLIMMQAGQSLALTPRWIGDPQPVDVEVQIQQSRVNAPTDGPLPSQSESALHTVVTAPLGVWVTLSRSGDVPVVGTYRSDAAVKVPRLLQLRVIAP